MLAAVDFQDPLLWALLIGWIMSVVLHEFAHGLVAHLGGDYTVRERGGLTLNPIQYIDPLTSIILPAVFLMLGGVPLPGGATYIRVDLLRSRLWQSAVSLAGPAMNFLIFLICAIFLHPSVGWADYSVPFSSWGNGPMFVSAMAILQLLAVMINLVPIPPLDGFGAISPWMDPELRDKLTQPSVSIFLMIGYFLVLSRVPGVFPAMYQVIDRLLFAMGFDELAVDYISAAYNRILLGIGW